MYKVERYKQSVVWAFGSRISLSLHRLYNLAQDYQMHYSFNSCRRRKAVRLATRFIAEC